VVISLEMGNTSTVVQGPYVACLIGNRAKLETGFLQEL
jgi:hypothetical protein